MASLCRHSMKKNCMTGFMLSILCWQEKSGKNVSSKGPFQLWCHKWPFIKIKGNWGLNFPSFSFLHCNQKSRRKIFENQSFSDLLQHAHVLKGRSRPRQQLKEPTAEVLNPPPPIPCPLWPWPHRPKTEGASPLVSEWPSWTKWHFSSKKLLVFKKRSKTNIWNET